MSKQVFSKNPIFCSSHFRRELLHVGGALARRRRQGLRPGPGARPADQLRTREIVLRTRLVSLNEEESPPMKNPLLKKFFLVWHFTSVGSPPKTHQWSNLLQDLIV